MQQTYRQPPLKDNEDSSIKILNKPVAMVKIVEIIKKEDAGSYMSLSISNLNL